MAHKIYSYPAQADEVPEFASYFRVRRHSKVVDRIVESVETYTRQYAIAHAKEMIRHFPFCDVEIAAVWQEDSNDIKHAPPDAVRS